MGAVHSARSSAPGSWIGSELCADRYSSCTNPRNVRLEGLDDVSLGGEFSLDVGSILNVAFLAIVVASAASDVMRYLVVYVHVRVRLSSRGPDRVMSLAIPTFTAVSSMGIVGLAAMQNLCDCYVLKL